MKDFTVKFLSVALVVLIVALGFILINSSVKTYVFSEEQNSVLFLSDGANPVGQISNLKNYDSFVVSPAFKENGELNGVMFKSLSVFNVGLIYNNKAPLTVARAFEGRKLLYCQANRGDVLINEKVSAVECNIDLHNLGESVLLEVNFPDYSLEKPKIVVSPNRVQIFPNSNQGVEDLPVLVLELMFGNSEQAFGKTNTIVDILHKEGKLGKDSNSSL
ncbi:MAG: hypothetical protein Q7K43_02160 [Candidatus Woesearchaeota archaeon]|nr:hypothetical protein [Candidatus Woesearchaeota archaeon]